MEFYKRNLTEAYHFTSENCGLTEMFNLLNATQLIRGKSEK